MIKVTYQKKNGDIIERYSTISAPYKIGETNGFGWKVINKEYSFDNKYYPSGEYDILLDKWAKREQIKRRFKKDFLRLYKEMSYMLFLLIVIKQIVLFIKGIM